MKPFSREMLLRSINNLEKPVESGLVVDLKIARIDKMIAEAQAQLNAFAGK